MSRFSALLSSAAFVKYKEPSQIVGIRSPAFQERPYRAFTLLDYHTTVVLCFQGVKNERGESQVPHTFLVVLNDMKEYRR
jgi:hypothetical protein